MKMTGGWRQLLRQTLVNCVDHTRSHTTNASRPLALASSRSNTAVYNSLALFPSFHGRRAAGIWSRAASTSTSTSTFVPSKPEHEEAQAREPQPASAAAVQKSFGDAPGVVAPGEKFVMLYTCRVCETRAAKTISKHAYRHGVVLIRCPGCQNLHLIADHLGWFDDERVDVESILRNRGESVKVVTCDNVLELTEQDLLGSLTSLGAPASTTTGAASASASATTSTATASSRTTEAATDDARRRET